MKPFVNDCHVNILELAWLTEEEEGAFSNDFRAVVSCLKQIRKKGDYRAVSTEALNHYYEVLTLLKTLAKDEIFDEKLYAIAEQEWKEGKTMVGNIFELVRDQTRAEVKAENARNLQVYRERLLAEGISTEEVDKIADILGLSNANKYT